jgi:glycerophosphoryl diester phosphodiesterase
VKIVRTFKRLVIISAIVFFLLLLYVSLSFSPAVFKDYDISTPNQKSITFIAHRGASKTAPENTIASIKSALNLKANFIEIDVRQTLDSVVVLIHDASLDRTTNGKGLISENTYSEIIKLDAGKWFSKNFMNEKIPTLEEVVKLVNGRCNLIIEIKEGNESYPNIEKNILQIIEEFDAENWIIIQSFNSDVLRTIHSLNPNIELHKLMFGKFRFVPFVLSNKIEKYEMEELKFIRTYSINYLFANYETLDLLKSNGKNVNVWTVDELQTAKDLISLGIDGIITNDLSIKKDITNQ